MKVLLTIFLLAFSSSNLLAQTKDTTYLFQSSLTHHTVFVDSTSKYKDLLTNFQFDAWDSSSYLNSIEHLLKTATLKKFDLKGFPRNWIPLKKYREHYYVYMPSDLGTHLKYRISDSTIVSYTMEAPFPLIIKKVKEVTSTHLKLSTLSLRGENEFEFKIVDSENGIAILTIEDIKNRITTKLLLVDADKVDKFQTIVNYCKESKVDEYMFEEVDFSMLEQ